MYIYKIDHVCFTNRLNILVLIRIESQVKQVNGR